MTTIVGLASCEIIQLEETGDNLQGLRKMFSAQLLIMIVMLVFLVITCHWCQARKLIVKKMSLSRKSVSGKIESEDYDVLAMV